METNIEQFAANICTFMRKTSFSEWFYSTIMLMNRPFYRFLMRWLVCSLGLWIAAGLIGESISYNDEFSVIVISGLVLAIINIVIKPVLVIFSLPAIVFTLGLFMVVINGLTVFIASKLYEPLHVTNLWAAIFAGMVIGLVNYLVTAILEDVKA